MSDQPQGPGWWQASDYKWYPPQPPAPPAYQQAPVYPPGPGYQQPLPPYPEKPKNSSKTGWIVGGVIVVVLLLLGGCVAVVFGATKSAVDEAKKNKATVVGSTVPGAPDVEAPSGGGGSVGSREAPLAQGVAVDLGNGWTVQVDAADVSPGATDVVLGANPFNEPPEAGSRYIVVTMTATYGGRDDAATEMPSLGFTASVFGSANVERNSFDAFVVPPDPQFDSIKELARGGSLSGNEAYQVGADETDLVLRITPTLTFDDTETWIRLG